MSHPQSFGLSAALTTAFDVKGAVDVAQTLTLAKWCLANGCSSLTFFGTTGEGPSIALPERQVLIEAALNSGVAASQIIVGVMGNSVVDAVEQARLGLSRGGKAVLLAPPSYFKNVSDDGVFQWYAAVFAALGDDLRDVILYNIPGVTGVELSVDLVGRLRAAFPSAITGVKDSSGAWAYTERLLAAHRDIAILIGDERDLARGVRLGGQGAISGMANLVPRRLNDLISTGRGDAALVGFVTELVKYPVVPSIKALVAQQTGQAGWARPRPPLAALPPAEVAHMIAAYAEALGAMA